MKESGTVSYPYKLAIIGGGPAGCSIIVRAIRIGMLKDLCDGNEATNTAGVCLIDKDNDDRFGGGKLQDYLINSNTWANKFVSNVIDVKDNVIPKETVVDTPLDCLRDHQRSKDLLLQGDKAAPLKSVGAFLHEVGTIVKNTINSFEKTSVCMSNTKVTAVERFIHHQTSSACGDLKDGKDSDETKAESSVLLWKIFASSETGPIVVYAMNLVLATGGFQEIPRFPITAHNSKVIASDLVNSGEALNEIVARMKAAGKKKIVIVGGSHSAFSAAWMCLNNLEVFTTTTDSSGIVTDSSSSPTKASSSSFASALVEKPSICIIHRSPIQVFYSTKKEADGDGYTDIGEINKTSGHIHPFGGLRADAKELWRSVKSGRDCRVKLVQTKNGSQTIQNKLFEDAAVIIWACGYSTNIVPFKNEYGRLLQFRKYKGQVEVDDDANILLESDKSIVVKDSTTPNKSNHAVGATAVDNGVVCGNLFGCGLGYGLKAVHDSGRPDGSSGRADGVAVYLKRNAALILAAVLGNKVFGGFNSWKDRMSVVKKLHQTSSIALSSGDPSTNSDQDTNGTETIVSSTCSNPVKKSLFSPPTSPVKARNSNSFRSYSLPEVAIPSAAMGSKGFKTKQLRLSCNNNSQAITVRSAASARGSNDVSSLLANTEKQVAVACFRDEIKQLESSMRLSMPRSIASSSNSSSSNSNRKIVSAHVHIRKTSSDSNNSNNLAALDIKDDSDQHPSAAVDVSDKIGANGSSYSMEEAKSMLLRLNSIGTVSCPQSSSSANTSLIEASPVVSAPTITPAKDSSKKGHASAAIKSRRVVSTTLLELPKLVAKQQH